MSNLEKVLYPETGTTKGEVIGYYVAIAPALIPHAANRPVTRKRWPNGVGTEDAPIQAFFEKDLGAGVPEWVPRRPVQHSEGPKQYPVVEEAATLAWLAQTAALELHVPQWQFDPDGGVGNPDRIVFDFDPGPGVDLPTTARVALAAKVILDGMGLTSFPVTSGSKGIHVYAPLDGRLTSANASEVAHELARAMEHDQPDLIVSDMKKSLRVGRVLIDWSQNNAKKTTIAPYSLRGRPHPNVAAPRTWDELADPHLRHLSLREMLDRFETDADLLADLTGAPAGRAERKPAREQVQIRSKVRTPPHTTPREGDQVPAGLRVPIEVMLARSAERLPGATALPGGTRWEPKWDGFRVVAVAQPVGVRLWSRQKKDLTDAFPDIADAIADQVPAGCVLDGEAVRWAGERLDFDALQRRLTTSPRTISHLVQTEPVSYIAFDLLAVAGRDLRNHPYSVRRQLLEELAADWQSPLSLSPVTDSHTIAKEWMRDMAPAGIEGVVAKGMDQLYEGGKRGWVKFKHRDTFELVAGAVTGTLTDPGELILGRYIDGELHIVGRTTPIHRNQLPALIAQLRPPEGEHPWPTLIRSTAYDRFNTKKDTPITLIQPIVVEISADVALAGDSLRHGARYIRTRPELKPEAITRQGP